MVGCGAAELVYDISLNYLGVRSQESGVRRKKSAFRSIKSRQYLMEAIQTMILNLPLFTPTDF
ncbi:MAG: hypothetical protein WBA93_14765 [Microcoleaceae cyanobacterium]